MQDGFRFHKGQAFRYGGRRIVSSHRARDADRTYVFKDGAGLPVTFTHEELVAAREANELLDWVPDQATREDGSPRRGPVVWELATEAERSVALRVQDYILAWAAAPGTPRTDAGLLPLIRETHARRKREAEEEGRYEPSAPCPSTVVKWIARWLAGGGKLDTAIPQTRRRGNRRPKLSVTARHLLAEALDQHYLCRPRQSAAAVHAKLSEQIEARNRRLPPAERMQVPSYAAVLHAIGELCKFTVDFCRRGPAYAREKWRAVGPGYVTERANEVWEIDDTRVDLVCLGADGKTVVGRPWLTVVVDRHTRMIMAFVVSFNPPDTRTVLEALRLAMKGMGGLLGDHPNIRGTYAARGRPTFIHVDNGKHYNSAALKRALARLGIGHRALPVGKAWYKGVVERLIGTISRQVFHTVPGTTYSGIFERDDEAPPEVVAVATLPELRAKLLRWVVEEYQCRHHKGIEDAPMRLWALSLARHPEDFPLAAQDIDAALSLTVARKARKNGLQFRHLHYHSDDVVRMLMSPGFEGEEVIIRVDEDNLEAIQFLNPLTSEWKPAFLKEDQVPQVRGRNLRQYELARALRRSRADEFGDDDPDFKATNAEVDRLEQQDAESPKLGNRTRAEAARERQLQHAARLTRPRAEHVVPDGEDPSSVIDRAATGGATPADAAPPPEEPRPIDERAWEARKRLNSRVHRKQED